MFSYRHAFHAGNHADVLKHTALIAILRHLTAKEAPLAVFDTHAGAGLYRLDGDYAQKSGEAHFGFLRLAMAMGTAPALAPALRDYVDMVGSFNLHGSHRVYPGSPFIAQRLLRPKDKLKLFELHPTEIKALSGNIAQLEAGRQVAVLREDGFEGMKKFLPPPQRRALALIDPSYELKSDYARVAGTVDDALKRFATGVYMVWYPVIPRPEAHDLPRKLKSAATRAGKAWLHCTLALPQAAVTPISRDAPPMGMRASGIFVVNPPHTLQHVLSEAMPQIASLLTNGTAKTFTIESNTP